jgi:hypothetical protein
MQEMYRKGQPLSEILNADYCDARMCYRWSENIAETESEAYKQARAKAGIK